MQLEERLPGRRRTVATFITFRDRAFSLLCSDDEGAWTTPMKLSSPIPDGRIEKAIYLIRDEKVMLDSDLAELYCVETKALNRAVKRNSRRFPPDFMFRLSSEEVSRLKYQIGASKKGRGGRRYLPYVFTEQGVAMPSSVLNSERAIRPRLRYNPSRLKSAETG